MYSKHSSIYMYVRGLMWEVNITSIFTSMTLIWHISFVIFIMIFQMFNDVFIIVSDIIFHAYIQFRLNTFKYSFENVFVIQSQFSKPILRLNCSHNWVYVSTNLWNIIPASLNSYKAVHIYGSWLIKQKKLRISFIFRSLKRITRTLLLYVPLNNNSCCLEYGLLKFNYIIKYRYILIKNKLLLNTWYIYIMAKMRYTVL